MIDVKKLITGFLILASAAACSGLVLAFVSNSPSSTINAAQITIDAASSSDTGNAFLPTETEQNIVADNSSSSALLTASTSDPNNLTDTLANTFIAQIGAANPNGATTDDAGNPLLISPNADSIAAVVADTTSTANLVIPDWDVEAGSQPVNVIATSSPAAIEQYATALSGVMDGNLNSQVQNILNNDTDDADADDLAYTQSQVQGALSQTISLPVPKPLVSFQKSLVKVLVYEKNMLALTITDSQTDPVKASLIFDGENTKFDAAEQDLQTQAQNVINAEVSMRGEFPVQVAQTPTSPTVAFVDRALGIKTANALLPVFDPATWALIESNEAQVIGHQLLVVLKNTLLQILKNTLIALIQRTVLTWVQGSGAPKFVTAWGTSLINAYETTALNYINSQMSCGVYPAYLPTLRLTLGSYYKPGNNSCANQFQAALGANTLQQFTRNFQNGSWLAFNSALLPSGNPYGGLFFQAQIVEANAANAKQATAAKSTASGGFSGNQVCDDSSNPNSGEHTVCENPDGPDYTLNGSGESCGPGDTPVVYANNGTCSDGTEPQITTPGTVTGFTLNTAIDAPAKNVAAANDIAGVLNAVLSSLINSLASAAVNGVGKAVNNGLTAIQPSSINGGTQPTPAQVPLTCNPSTQTVPANVNITVPTPGTTTPTSTSPITLSATGGTTDSSGNPPTYTWVSSVDGLTSNGSIFTDAYPNAGNYAITLSDSAGDAPVTCTVIVQ